MFTINNVKIIGCKLLTVIVFNLQYKYTICTPPPFRTQLKNRQPGVASVHTHKTTANNYVAGSYQPEEAQVDFRWASGLAQTAPTMTLTCRQPGSVIISLLDLHTDSLTCGQL